MLEIESFNALFAAAKNGKFLLESFRQDAAGFFYCRWRLGEKVGPELQRRLPFNAAIDSFLALRDVIRADDEPAPQDDLFG